MQLTSSAPAPDSPIIRTGSDGRLRYSPEQRQTLLGAFDRGGQSALAFSRSHGVSYKTFIAWLRKRRVGGCRRWFKTRFFAGAKLDSFQREMAENRGPC
jgi:transposase-like protein